MGLTVEKCLQAWTNSLRQMNAKADIVFFGDSLTYYGDFASVFPDKVVCNLGLRGDNIQGMIDRVEQVRILEPKKVFLMAGVNNLTASSTEEFKELYCRLVCAFFKQIPSVELIIQSLLPVNDRDFFIRSNNEKIVACNNMILSIANKFKLNHLDLFSHYVIDGILPMDYTNDGIHLRPGAYDAWYHLLRKSNA